MNAFKEKGAVAWPRLKVSVLVDLRWRPEAGGHVKCWERLAEAAARSDAGIDLTVHFQGERESVVTLAPHVRYRLHRPVFSSARLPFLSHVPDHTDLAPWHPGLTRALAEADLIHTTDAYFAYARTAERLVRRQGTPLVHSVHTDTPRYTRLYTAQTLERLVGRGALGRLLCDRLRLPERGEQKMRRRLLRHAALCRTLLAAGPEDRQQALRVLPAERVGILRRGIDRQRFDPARRDRPALVHRLGLPPAVSAPSTLLLVYAGRIDRGKNVMVLVEAVAQLAAEGFDLHLLCIGQGADRPAVQERLGPRASCPGALDQDSLALACAAADIFVLPSLIERHSNVVQEAMSSGLPAVVAAVKGAPSVVESGRNGLVVADGADPRSWTAALRSLAADPARMRAMGRAARVFAETRLPSWDQVLAEDLVPVWRAAVGWSERAWRGVEPCWDRAS